MKRESYMTKQKEKIFEIIRNEKQSFTIKNLYLKLNREVGLTTIYRLVDKLVMDKILKKELGENNITYYEYLEECDNKNHFYLKCNCCSKLIHIDCNCITNLEEHIIKTHKFHINKENIIINGICFECRNK